MNDQQLSELLKSLPREPAPDGFTDRVLERLERPAPSRRRGFLLIAASVCLLAATVLGLRQSRLETQHRLEQETRAQLEQLWTEQQALEVQLEELARLKKERPVLYLGGDDEVDIVFDVERFRARRGLSVQPASLTGASDRN